MDLVFELLEDPAYQHVLLNHLPLTGLAFSWIALVFGVLERRTPSILFGLALVLVTSGSATLVMNAGEDAYPLAYDGLDGIGRAWLDHHTYLADRWGWLFVANAVAGAAAIAVGIWQKRWLRPSAIFLLGTTLVSLGTAAVLAEAGGKIRHPEFRLSDPPKHDTSLRQR